MPGRRLRGRYDTSMDSKGRIGLPTNLRQKLDEEVTVVKWKDHLIVMHPDDLEKVIGHVGERVSLDNREGLQNFFDLKSQQDRRYFFSNMYDLAFDAQGRLTIPKQLRTKLMMDEDEGVVWLGCEDYLELWAKPSYLADCARWEEAGGYQDLFNAPSLPNNPSAPESGPGLEGDDQDRA